jgi:hypothetical protein
LRSWSSASQGASSNFLRPHFFIDAERLEISVMTEMISLDIEARAGDKIGMARQIDEVD